MQLFVCSVYITNTGPRRERSYNPAVRYSDSPQGLQSDSPTEMCLLFTFIDKATGRK